jgi:DNA (cytosine-5)-methyltransferase 1
MEFVDLFCGAGGLSLGLRQAGLHQRLAVDADKLAVATYKRNFPRSRVVQATIETLTRKDIRGAVNDTGNYVLAGCPPCQLFSRLHQKDPGGDHVIFSYLALVKAVRAPYLVFENVPQITKYSQIWSTFLATLHESGYELWSEVVNAADFGVPQHRRRIVVIASRRGMVTPLLRKCTLRTVRDAIYNLAEDDDSIGNHVTLKMSPANLARIQKISSAGGGSRKGDVFSDSYSRMHWDRPAPTITTRCISFSNGRFGHPEYNRALTVREAARLQGFPDSFVFEGGVWNAAKQVGNAVPPPLARWLGRAILKHESLRS